MPLFSAPALKVRKRQPRRLLVEAFDQRINPSGCGCQLPPSQVSGLVYVDQNANGVAEDTEPRLAGVTITINGTSADGDAVNLTATTDAGGIYTFTGLEAGTYAIQATTPAGYTAGQSSIGVFGGTIGANLTTNVAIPQGQSSGGYNFGELVPPPNPCEPPPRPRSNDCDRDEDHDCRKKDRHKDRDSFDRGNHFGWDRRNCKDDDRGHGKNKDRCDRDDRHKDRDYRPKGNNGVGNGEDPHPPGNPPINDGTGAAPGKPGNKGGAKK
jgi:hypothetical protein